MVLVRVIKTKDHTPVSDEGGVVWWILVEAELPVRRLTAISVDSSVTFVCLRCCFCCLDVRVMGFLRIAVRRYIDVLCMCKIAVSFHTILKAIKTRLSFCLYPCLAIGILPQQIRPSPGANKDAALPPSYTHRTSHIILPSTTSFNPSKSPPSLPSFLPPSRLRYKKKT